MHRLEEEVRRLEEEIRHAEAVPKSLPWSNPLLASGEVTVKKASSEPLLAWYPGKRLGPLNVEYFVVQADQAPYMSVIPQTIILHDLQSWNQDGEVPSSLRRRL